MSLANLAAEIFMNATKTSKGKEDVMSALVGLLGGADNDLDLGDLISKFQSGGLEAAVSSWLGDGANNGLDVSSILSILGQSQVSKFAGQLDMNEGDALSGLGDMIPRLIDQSSSGGSLLDSVGGLDGALKMAKGFF